MDSSTDGGILWVAKTVVFAIPPTMASIYFPGRGHQLIFGVSLVVAALLQALIPPRKKGLFPLLCIVVAICVVNYIFLR